MRIPIRKIDPKLVILVLALSFIAPALATPERPFPRQRPDRASASDIKETVELYMLVRLKEDVGLTAEQEKRLVPLLREQEKFKRETGAERKRLIDELRLLVDLEAAGDTDIRTRLERLRELELGERARRDALIPEIQSILDTSQQARLLLFFEGFPREMRDRIRGVRSLRSGQGPAAETGAGTSPDDGEGDVDR